MSTAEILLLSAAGLLAGAVNAVAGGGTFFSFSALLAAGVPPIAANATSAVAMVPGYLASAFAYRREIRGHFRHFAALGLVSLAGGAVGAWLLLRLGDQSFRSLIPWLLLAATALFVAAPRLTRAARRMSRPARAPGGSARRLAARAFHFLVSVYGGFFGAGMGIVMLAALAVTEGDDFHWINAAKNLLSFLIQGVAVGLFIAAGIVHWPQAAVTTLAAMAGGYLGIVAAKRVAPPWIRRFVVATGAILSIYFLLVD